MHLLRMMCRLLVLLLLTGVRMLLRVAYRQTVRIHLRPRHGVSQINFRAHVHTIVCNRFTACQKQHKNASQPQRGNCSRHQHDFLSHTGAQPPHQDPAVNKTGDDIRYTLRVEDGNSTALKGRTMPMGTIATIGTPYGIDIGIIPGNMPWKPPAGSPAPGGIPPAAAVAEEAVVAPVSCDCTARKLYQCCSPYQDGGAQFRVAVIVARYGEQAW